MMAFNFVWFPAQNDGTSASDAPSMLHRLIARCWINWKALVLTLKASGAANILRTFPHQVNLNSSAQILSPEYSFQRLHEFVMRASDGPESAVDS